MADITLDSRSVLAHALGRAPCCFANRHDLKAWQRITSISRFIDRHEYAPTFREVAPMWGIRSEGSALAYARSLQDRGWLEIGTTHRAREMRITRTGRLAMLDYIQWQVGHGNEQDVKQRRTEPNARTEQAA